MLANLLIGTLIGVGVVLAIYVLLGLGFEWLAMIETRTNASLDKTLAERIPHGDWPALPADFRTSHSASLSRKGAGQ